MVLVIAVKEYIPRLDRYRTVISHGINLNTDEIVILPQVSPEEIGAVFNTELGEYVLCDF